MDVVGTASAVLGILQVGFSLAKAIRETVKDYKDAADDLISLAQEIESTLYLVSQLDRLVVDNKKTGTFNDGGMAELNRCLKSTEQIVSALVELLTKTGVSHPSGTKVNPENLIISRPHRRKWLGQKSRVKEKQEELNKVRLEVTTIILLRDTLQADQSSNKAMQQALVTAERDRRRKARARRRRQKGNPRVRQPGPNARKITTGMDPAHFATPPSARVDRNGDRGFESFAYRTEVSPPGPTGTETTKSTSSESNIADLNIDNDKTATEKQVKDEDTTRNTISDIIANHKTAKGGSTAADFDAYFTAHANVANPGSIMNVENVPSGLADGTSPMIHNSVHHNQPRFSSEVIIEEFKRQTKAEGMKLSEAYQAMMERATKHAGRDEPDHGLRRFLESEYAQEWADMFGDWLPGTRPELTTSPNAHKVEVKPSKLQRWSFPSLRDKQHKPKTEPQSLNLPRSAHLLVVERHAEKPDILRLNPPERFQRPDLRKTGLIWSNFEDGTKEAVWQTLRFEFMLPDAFQWVLHDAMMVDPGPSLLTRGLIRLLPRLEYKKVNKDSYIVVFVPTNSTQSRPDPFGQVDVADHGLSDGPPVPAGAIPGPYSPQNHRREDRTETAIPSQEHRYTPVYAGEPDAMYPRHYTTSPAFARPGPVPLADRVSLDQMPSERIPVNRMPADRMPVDRMPIDRMQDDRMQLDPMPSYRVSRRRHSTPPPNDANRGYQQRVPRPRNGYPPDRNGYPPFSEDPRPGAPRARKSARLPSDVHISKLQDSDPRRPAVSSAPTGLTRLASYRRLRGSNQPWSKSDSSGENSDVSSSAATTVSSFIPDSWACIRSTSMGARFLPSEATDSSDQSDDSLDDDELYDQLLRKFTGHGLRERESANGNTDGRLKGDDEEVSGNVSGNGNTNVNVGVDAENTDKITDGDADDRTIDRDDKSDPQNQDLYR